MRVKKFPNIIKFSAGLPAKLDGVDELLFVSLNLNFA
jgi:hypothetical protein